MRARRYMDFDLPSGAGAPRPVIASALVQALHGVFAAHPGEYALALPGWSGEGEPASEPWRALRIFAEDLEALDRLMQRLERHPVVRDYTRAGFPRPVPEGFEGPWVEYRRYRVSSRKAGVDALRHRRLTDATERGLPFLQVRSASNGQAFVLGVEPRPSTPRRSDADAAPDSYGLSVTSRAFALPHIPLE